MALPQTTGTVGGLNGFNVSVAGGSYDWLTQTRTTNATGVPAVIANSNGVVQAGSTALASNLNTSRHICGEYFNYHW